MLPDNQIDYINILESLKQKIRQARIKATYNANSQMLTVFWEIGKTILDQQKSEGWGTKVIKRLAQDLKSEFPEMKGLSERNLVYMQSFAANYPDFLITQGALAKLPWYHHITLLDKVKNDNERLFYIMETALNGWSRDVMVHQIESGLYTRKGKIISNFKQTIEPDQSELVQQVFKDPYKFDFIYLGNEAKERDIEDALTNQLTKFLLELGQYFSFIRSHRL